MQASERFKILKILSTAHTQNSQDVQVNDVSFVAEKILQRRAKNEIAVENDVIHRASCC